MSQIFLIIVVVLFFLAIADLIVGVSNDAVNFLNSAIGSRAAKLSTIMVVAIAGILTGVLFSNGMMGIARTGIFFPSMYYFNEVMYIFLAVVISDVILIDTFSSFGLPTSTTVSIIFELLGASVAVALFKTLAESGNIDALGSYINTGKALAIISGILLSVVIAFTVGAIVQYLSRILFTFQFKDKIRFLGGLWGGFAVTAIIYFMVIKGARGASFMNPALLAYIETNTIWILSISLVGWSLFFQLLIWLFNTNVLKITVLLGTFALAMAFAGNDLVNFIGVPLAGFESFRIFLANQGVQPDNLLMGDLMNPIKTPTYILLIAGGIMSVTLVFSKKAKTVISTSVDLSRQDEGSEKFPSFALSRSIVRSAVNTGKTIDTIMPEFLKSFLCRRFQQPDEDEIKQARSEGISFDLVRASVNLVVASILIAFGTSNKLPLSTTYVTFMVAMGSSFADGAWGRESAVYRISGVLIVIGGWFITALIAFSFAFLNATIIFNGEPYSIPILLFVAGYVAFRQHRTFKRKEKELKEENKSQVTKPIDSANIVDRCKEDILMALTTSNELYTKLLTHLYGEDLKKLRALQKEVTKFSKHTKRLKDDINTVVTKLKDDSIETGHYYVQVIDFLREIAHCINYISEPCLNHVANNHKGLLSQQKTELVKLTKDVSQLILMISNAITKDDYSIREQVLKIQQTVVDDIERARRAQVRRIKSREAGTKNSVLFLNILAETKNLVLFITNLYKSQRDFITTMRSTKE
ncbi:MAG TPA: phosphate permease [Bacteroidales bacterium]|nr:MAG: hypothetical protein A2X11_15330 [Bacteroidetes bacterium GWE2_42_24]OFY31713.1 MAG: hypothetical protein A2X09_09075 [Bacteroidetes bacterium GWF2_43_11]HAQ65816.1 phosphate permease [Bacteroidales bacterium]HBZ67020.1 phosphate permease [Bacteroidales bacterium]